MRVTWISLLVVAAHVPALAWSSDFGTNVRGSLGPSIDDLSLDASAGSWMFVVNALCALTFVMIARQITRDVSHPRDPGAARRIQARPILAM
jgi:hypothetical protein